jgi:hypothetical protein
MNHTLTATINRLRRRLAAPVRRPRSPAGRQPRRRRRHRVRADHEPTSTADRLTTIETDPRPVHGIILRIDGQHHLLHDPVTVDELHLILAALDVATARRPAQDLVMYLDPEGDQRRRPCNPTATALYGTGMPILGNVLLTTDDNQPLPEDLVNTLVGQ